MVTESSGSDNSPRARDGRGTQIKRARGAGMGASGQLGTTTRLGPVRLVVKSADSIVFYEGE